MSTSTPSLYAAAASVPLIISPALSYAPPPQLPTTLHPLPPNVADYFVYPFNLERFVLDEAARREREKRETMRRVAPGWNGSEGSVLQPTRVSSSSQQLGQGQYETGEIGAKGNEKDEEEEDQWTRAFGEAAARASSSQI